MRNGGTLRTILGCLWLGGSAALASEIESVDFARDVRPIFNANCAACHGGVKETSGLSFAYEDSVAPYIEAGDASASMLIDRVVDDDPDFVMPPPEHGPPLSAEQVETLRQWIDQGARWGEHWAFEPPAMAALPKANQGSESLGPVDVLINDALRREGLTANPPAGPTRWLRRMRMDLTGTPPTAGELNRFGAELASSAEAAFVRAVDRALADPGFGHVLGSVWLDAVRYADSRGLGQDGRREMWKYRDWVIDTFNRGVPMDEFTRMQIAGDLMPPTDDPASDLDRLIATAAHRLTQTNEEGGTDDEEFRTEAVLDRVATVWQAWMGVSFGCVQCHSHPYDPIRHEEYYRFAAFFNDTADWDLTDDLPKVSVPVDERDRAVAAELDRRIETERRADWEAGDAAVEESDWRTLTDIEASTDKSTAIEVVGDAVDEFRLVGTVEHHMGITVGAPTPRGLRRLTALRLTGLPIDPAAAERDAELGFVVSSIGVSLSSPHGEPRKVPVVAVLSDEPSPLIDPARSLDTDDPMGVGPYPRMLTTRTAVFVVEPADLGEGDRVTVTMRFDHATNGSYPMIARRGRVAVTGDEALHRWRTDPRRVAARERIDAWRSVRHEIRSVGLPVTRQRDARFSRASFVFDRGNRLTKTDRVTAGTPGLFPPIGAEDATPDRTDLADWMVRDDHPLTARVMVNRVWAMLFGRGIVPTQEDFGSSGATPSHPELLDDLAARFAGEMAWDVKRLCRELVLSAAYRRSSRATPKSMAVDPSNRWRWRGPSGRYPAETIRDAALAAAGLLDRSIGGPPVHPPIPEGVWKPFQADDAWETGDDGSRYRRTVYTYTKRSIPYPMMQAFDAPTREFCSARRMTSNTPLQSLMTLNDTTFVEAAAALGAAMRTSGGDFDDRLTLGFRRVLSRAPTDDERTALRTLTSDVDGDGWDAVAMVLLNLDEAMTR